VVVLLLLLAYRGMCQPGLRTSNSMPDESDTLLQIPLGAGPGTFEADGQGISSSSAVGHLVILLEFPMSHVVGLQDVRGSENCAYLSSVA
jgi:hypothetical protein